MISHMIHCMTLSMVACCSAWAGTTPLGTSITYQGQLRSGGTPAIGEHDFRLFLYEDELGTILAAPFVEALNVPVIDGLFMVDLDFGTGAFNGDARWLKIWVRQSSNPDPGYEALNPWKRPAVDLKSPADSGRVARPLRLSV